MKKRELMLDFTSLLDVILILLFIVIANMNQASAAAGEELTAKLNEADVQIQMLEQEREQLLSGMEEMRISAAENDAAAQELEQLRERYAQLQEEYDHLKITTDYDEDDVEVYREAIERITHVVLICETKPDAGPDKQEVQVNIYLDGKEDETQSFGGTAVILHDFSLSREDREILIAQQTIDMTKALAAALRENQSKMIWFSIQYAYDDENIANSDIQLIKKAIENIEHNFDMPCYAKEMKIY